MHEASLFQVFLTRLESSELRYVVTGSVAAMIYGEPRLTHDLDLVLEIGGIPDIKKILTLFPESEFYVPPAEIIAVEMRRERRGHFNLIHLESGYKADVYLIGDDPFQIWAIENARRLGFGDTSIAVAPPEYVIIRKLQFYKEGGSEKHLRDIRGMLMGQTSLIDKEVIQKWADWGWVTKEWEMIKGSIS